MSDKRLLIAGNWKMNGSKADALGLLSAIVAGYPDKGAVDVAVFPPSIYLPLAEQVLSGTSIAWGAQNVSDKANGAYTGEISLAMLADFDCRYVIVGHSERRALYGESNDIVASKFAAAKAQQIIPILCVGETAAQRRDQLTMQVITEQLSAVLALPSGVALLENAVVAYEPVWAIGTGQTATPEQAQQVHQAIRAYIAERDETIAKELTILYGGSLKAANAQALLSMPDIDGGLIGGASLKSDEFLQIIQTASEI